MLIYDYNSNAHTYHEPLSELGDKKKFTFAYYDCPCGEGRYKIVSTTSRHKDDYNFVQCNNCGTIRINPYLSDESIDEYYAKYYGPIKRRGVTAADLYINQSKTTDKLYEFLHKHITQADKILDFGGGAGGRTKKLVDEGFNVSIIDSDLKYRQYALTKNMHQHIEGNKYNLIVLSHVLEHINHPVAFLEYLKTTLLAENGKIYIEVPFIENVRQGYLLNDFHVAHKFYFTSLSLRFLLQNNKYKIIDECKNGYLVEMDNQIVDLPTSSEMMAMSNKVIAFSHKNEIFIKLKNT